MNSYKNNFFYLAITFWIFSSNAFASDSDSLKGHSIKHSSVNRTPVNYIGEGDQYQNYYDGMWTGFYTNLISISVFDENQFERDVNLGYDRQLDNLVYGIRAKGSMVFFQDSFAAAIEFATRIGFSAGNGLYYAVGGANFVEKIFNELYIGVGLEQMISDSASLFVEHNYQLFGNTTLSPHRIILGFSWHF